jgi:dihydropteroate synthase
MSETGVRKLLEREVVEWRLRTRSLELGRRTLVMGVVNITPDSFSDGGLFLDPEAAVAHAQRLLDEGAEILDLGAESTRPGSRAGGAAGSESAPAVSAEAEQARLLPVLEGILAARPQAIVSVDTYKAATARAAIAAGAEIVNDVSGFTWDAAMPATLATLNCGAILMHSRGRPHEWASQPPAADPVALVLSHLAENLEAARTAGIAPERIVLDPGFGFGKRGDENYLLLARFAELHSLGRPLLAALSRKGFLGRSVAARLNVAELPPEARDSATIAASVAAALAGAHIVRVHAVRPTVEALAIADAILGARA